MTRMRVAALVAGLVVAEIAFVCAAGWVVLTALGKGMPWLGF